VLTCACRAVLGSFETACVGAGGAEGSFDIHKDGIAPANHVGGDLAEAALGEGVPDRGLEVRSRPNVTVADARDDRELD